MSDSAKKKQNLTSHKMLVGSLVSFTMLYLAGSWAIDSGSLWAYLLTYACLYYGIYFANQARKKYLK